MPTTCAESGFAEDTSDGRCGNITVVQRLGTPRLSERTHILIADDHPLILGALRHALIGAIEGAEIHEARDLETLSAALEATPDMDLVLLDLAMPGVRGFSGLVYLRARRAGGRRIGQSRSRGDARLHRARRGRLYPEIARPRDDARRGPRGSRRRPLDPARTRSRRARRPEFAPRLAPAFLAHPAAGARPDDAVRGPAQQADRLRAVGLRSDGEGACLGDPAKARRRKPHPSGDRGREYRERPLARQAGVRLRGEGGANRRTRGSAELERYARYSSPVEDGGGGSRVSAVEGATAFQDNSQPPQAPPPCFRMVPLPRFASLHGGGFGAFPACAGMIPR